MKALVNELEEFKVKSLLYRRSVQFISIYYHDLVILPLPMWRMAVLRTDQIFYGIRTCKQSVAIVNMTCDE